MGCHFLLHISGILNRENFISGNCYTGDFRVERPGVGERGIFEVIRSETLCPSLELEGKGPGLPGRNGGRSGSRCKSGSRGRGSRCRRCPRQPKGGQTPCFSSPRQSLRQGLPPPELRQKTEGAGGWGPRPAWHQTGGTGRPAAPLRPSLQDASAFSVVSGGSDPRLPPPQAS